jgi:hypothetical protein
MSSEDEVDGEHSNKISTLNWFDMFVQSVYFI